jgi:hypothetical protein
MLHVLCLLIIITCTTACQYHSHSNGLPHRSDIILTSRTAHYTPAIGQGSGSGEYTTFTAAKAFHATRLDWLYSRNASFVSELKQFGMSDISLAMNPQTADANGSSWQVGRVININGDKLVAPWMRQWPGKKRYYGCVNNPAYTNVAHTFADTLIDAGATAIQHDDPTSNAEVVGWSNGDPTESGCYCDVCMKGFTKKLMETLNTTVKKSLNVSSTFNYRNYLLKNQSTSSKRTILREMFVEYQINVTKKYIHDLKQHVDNRTSSSVPLSCNNGGQWDDIYSSFDYGMGELSMHDATPGGLRYIFVDGVPVGKKQIMTMPKSKNITVNDQQVIRLSIAQSYALGSQVLIPWDIYLPDPLPERYYGSAEEYGNLYTFVKTYANVLNETSMFHHYTPSTKNMILNFTGNVKNGGDGKRFRLPVDNPPSKGYALPGNVGTCAWYCNIRKNCNGMFVNGRSTCYLLTGKLDIISGTLMSGNSYSFNGSRGNDEYISTNEMSSLVPRVFSSDPLLDIVVRSSCDNKTVAVHLINWKKISFNGKEQSSAHHSQGNDFEILFVGVGCETNIQFATPFNQTETYLHPTNCTMDQSWYTIQSLIGWGMLMLQL